MARGSRRRRTPPSPRELYQRPSKSRALQRGLTRERGSSFDLDRYNRRHESAEASDGETSNDGNNDGLNAGDGSYAGGRSSDVGGSDGGSTGEHRLHDDGDHASVESLSRLQPIDVDAVARPLDGNVIRAEVAQFDDDEIQFDGVDAPLQEVLMVDMMNDEERLLNRHNAVNNAVVGDFVEVEDEGGNDNDDGQILGQYSDDGSGSEYNPSDDEDKEDENSAVSRHVAESQETPTVVASQLTEHADHDNDDANYTLTVQSPDEDTHSGDAKTSDDPPSPFPAEPYSVAPKSATPYTIEWTEADEINQVIDTTDVPAKGDCGYIACIEGLIDLRNKFPDQFNSDAFLQLDSSWEGVKRFRKMLLNFVNTEYPSLMNTKKNPVQNWAGQPYPAQYILNKNPESMAVIDKFKKRLWIESFSNPGVGLHTMKNLSQWFHVEKTAPIISMIFEVSIYCFSTSYLEIKETEQTHHPVTTSVFLRRPDELGVMTNRYANKVLWPHDEKCLFLKFITGGSHYMKGTIKTGPRTIFVGWG